jgi:hypothetical protein
MAAQDHTGDAFKDRLAQAATATGRPELAHQSRGRDLSEAESALAAALMEIYGSGVTEMAEVATALSERGIAIPSGAAGPWTADLLVTELRAANESLDAAYLVNGYGA